MSDHYKAQPTYLLAHLIGHEGRGSLLSELKARGLVNSLVGGPKSGAKGFGFFTINVDMTLVGIKNVDEIISLIFQYLKMVRTEGEKEQQLKWTFSEPCRFIFGCFHLPSL